MSAELHFWHPSFLADPNGNLRSRYQNTVSTPIESMTWLDNGQATPGVWEITISRSGGIVTAQTVSLLASASKNYWHNPSGVVVTADGTTVNTHVIGGLGIVFASTVDTGHKARVVIGNYLATNGSFTLFGSADIVRAGTNTNAVRVAVKNVGSEDAAECVVYALPGAFGFGPGWTTFIKTVREHPSTARHKLARGIPGDHVITFADWKDAGGGKKSADVYVDGVKAIEDGRFDGVTTYYYGSGNGYIDANDGFTGLMVILANTVENPTSATLTLRVSPVDDRWVQFASDNGGTPGTFANQDLTLTESGKPTGVISAGGAAFFWVRWAVPIDAVPGPERHTPWIIRGLSI